jgi:tRNA (guanine10-N2)-dimethyltransferase
MNHFFILGNHPELSVAELTACFDFKKMKLLDEVLLGNVEIPEAHELIKNLGGTIKIGRLIGRLTKAELYEKMLEELQSATKDGKFNFGISLYGKSKINTHKLGIELKMALKQEGISCRFVTSRDTNLSSVVVEQNKLVNGGRELVLIMEEQWIVLGVTEAVQPFKELSRRDYGRPARDDHSGMLPPKLAQIMVNLARLKKNEILLDPFCGSGTIITEAMLMGYTKIYGSDLSAKARADTKANLDWINKEYNLDIHPELQVIDARVLAQKYKENSIGAIVTETYLGPQRGHVDIQSVAFELEDLYSAVLKQFEHILKPNARAIIALPYFVLAKKHLNPKVPSGLSKKDSYMYGRDGQKVWRDIIILQKK